ncbi:hypothetical protein HY636_02745, partial [Candidatus Woesearchaeota archaeon]|nr:hypothetical protein [Candidatus Woesearchaeota archaeon]
MRFKITTALLSLAILLGNPVDTNKENIEKISVHHKKSDKKGSKNTVGSKGSQKGMNKTDTTSLDGVVGFCERVKEICEDVREETASFTSELFTFYDEDSSEDKEYKLRLEEHIKGLFALIPKGYIPKEFIDEYFAEFIGSYFVDYKQYRFLPKAVIVVNKTKTCNQAKPQTKGCKSSYYMYYFN